VAEIDGREFLAPLVGRFDRAKEVRIDAMPDDADAGLRAIAVELSLEADRLAAVLAQACRRRSTRSASVRLQFKEGRHFTGSQPGAKMARSCGLSCQPGKAMHVAQSGGAAASGLHRMTCVPQS
jgi:hypothetical protein